MIARLLLGLFALVVGWRFWVLLIALGLASGCATQCFRIIGAIGPDTLIVFDECRGVVVTRELPDSPPPVVPRPSPDQKVPI